MSKKNPTFASTNGASHNQPRETMTLVEILDPHFSYYPHKDPEFYNLLERAGESDRCECCGSRISWRCLCEDEDGDLHWFGMTCASKVIDAGSIEEAKAKREKRLCRSYRNATFEVDGFQEWCRTQPHPKGWDNRTLLGYIVFYSKNGTDKSVARHVKPHLSRFIKEQQAK